MKWLLIDIAYYATVKEEHYFISGVKHHKPNQTKPDPIYEFVVYFHFIL
jgi:hypothetical protein